MATKSRQQVAHQDFTYLRPISQIYHTITKVSVGDEK